LIKLEVVDTFSDLSEELGFSGKPLWLNQPQLRRIRPSISHVQVATFIWKGQDELMQEQVLKAPNF
jgi:hypothetical protein